MVVVGVEVVVVFGILVVLFVTQLAVERLPHLHDGLCQFLLLLCLALGGDGEGQMPYETPTQLVWV